MSALRRIWKGVHVFKESSPNYKIYLPLADRRCTEGVGEVRIIQYLPNMRILQFSNSDVE
jgi:hypothetical protein